MTRTRSASWTALVALLFTATLTRAADEAPAGIKLGDPAPMADVQMKAVDGKELSLGEVKGKNGLLVVFACNACPFVKAWHDRIVTLGNAYSERGVGVVMVNANDPGKVPADGYAEMQERAKSGGYKFAYVVDGTSKIARAFGAAHTPEAFLFDARGQLVYHGAIDDNAKEADKVEHPYLKDALEAVASGKEVAVKETKALGCSIKYRAGA